MKTAEIIRKLCVENRISVTNLEIELGFSNGSLLKNSSMKSDRLLAVAKYFNVSMEYLMGVDEYTPTRIVSEDEYEFIQKYRKISDEARLMLNDSLDSAYRIYLQKGDSKTNSDSSKVVNMQ